MTIQYQNKGCKQVDTSVNKVLTCTTSATLLDQRVDCANIDAS